MREMKDETVYVTGESRTSVENAITKTYGAFYVAFEINGRTGEIVEADCSGTLELTRSFVRRMFVGKRILEENDGGIIFLPGRPYILTVLTSEMESNKEGREVIGHISRIVFDALS